MTLAAYRLGIRVFTFFALVAWGSVVFTVDPETMGPGAVYLFFGTLFVALLGLLTLFVTWSYCRGLGEASAAHHLGSAFRQAFLLALCGVGLTLFQYWHILTWWDALLLVVFMLLLEFSLRREALREDA
jgi:hypothetical protein